MGLRRKSRELALQFLFGHDLQGRFSDPDCVAQALDVFGQCFEVENKPFDHAKYLITGLIGHCAEIDELLSASSHNWRLERMSLVDRNILRIAVFEMQHCADVPAQVAINEALEIAKRYSVRDSVGFINGILDSISGR
ncbi:MAG: transcription antitermination factor NusB [Desulfobulbus propionicus]|nr:MAG: transcription antitermination factor NusB [Desulfobulbus propionicus]